MRRGNQTSEFDLVDAVSRLNVWSRGDERAPHKPLLLLYAIGRYLAGAPRLIPYGEVEAPLKRLLSDFGPPRTPHPEYPFWYLQTDGFWELRDAADRAVDPGPRGVGGTTPRRRDLLDAGVTGGFSEAAYAVTTRDPRAATTAVRSILDANFPATAFDDILQATGIELANLVARRPRDPEFRSMILRAYQNACAICGYSSRIGDVLVGVEAAHIKWHQAAGPDDYPNGVALCSLHHKLFDRGMISLTPDHRVLVSELATGTGLFSHLVETFHGRPLRAPLRAEYRPTETFVAWHVREVFRGPGRALN